MAGLAGVDWHAESGVTLDFVRTGGDEPVEARAAVQLKGDLAADSIEHEPYKYHSP